MLAPDQQLSLLIEKPAVGGAMIARADGQVVLVGGAIPGERVTARIDRVAKGVAHATAVAIEDPSPDRREVGGDPRCGGSLYAHIAYERQIAIKSQVVADAFARIGHIDIPPPRVAPSREDGYRMRARLHTRHGRIGFFREATHDLCDARATQQLLPSTVDVMSRVGATLGSLRLDVISDIDVSENIDASERAIALHAAAAFDPRLLAGINAAGGLTGVIVAGASRSPALLDGAPYVVDALEVEGRPMRLRRHVLSFFQGNRYLLEALATYVIGRVDPGVDVIDLYAGVGLFAVSAAVARGSRVIAVEGDRFGAGDLKANSEADASIACVHESVESFTRRSAAAPAATLIVDPPRTGMSREAVDGALRLEARRIVYVSCDVATLARDARRFVDGGYRPVSIEAFDLFPNTPHVETVVAFDR